MDDLRTAPGLMRRGWLRLLDGDRRWGSIDVRPDRFGVTRYRLVVYPPGISDAERRRVRIARGWPLWGVLLWVVSEIWFGQMVGPWTALSMSVAVFLGSGLVAFAVAGAPRTRVRTMGAIVMVGQYDPVAVAARDRLAALAQTLMDADEQLADGHLSTTAHESIWWQVYDEMAAGPNATPGMQWSGRSA